MQPTTTVPVPNYGDPVLDSQGKPVGVAEFNPNTGQPLQNPNPQNNIVDNSKLTSLGITPDQIAALNSPQGMDQMSFSNLIGGVEQKLKTNNDLVTTRGYLIKHLYDSPLTQDQMTQLPPEIQTVVQGGNKDNIELQLRLINDQISGRANTLSQSIQYLTDGYKTYQAQVEKSKQDAQTIIEDALTRSGSLAFKGYPDSIKRQLEQQAGYPTGYLDSVSPTINQTRYAAQYGSGTGTVDIKIPTGTIAARTNNPLNIKFSNLSSTLGGGDSGIGAQDGGTFAQFTTPEAGLDAAKQLLSSPLYNDLTVTQAMNQWSNNAYGAEISSFPATKKISDLTSPEMDQLVSDMAKRESGATVSTTASDIQEIAKGIESGLQPPTTTGLYGKSAAVKAQLQRDGFDLTKASTDWTATQKWLATANGSQQVRLKQAISSVAQGVSQLKTLATQWNAGGFAPLNALNLKAALNGVYGQGAQQLAAQFQQQATIVQDELGQTFMGGNSPTDKALSLAGQVFDTNWSATTLNSALDNLDKNLTFRSNAIENVGPTGVGGGPANVGPASDNSSSNDPLGIR